MSELKFLFASLLVHPDNVASIDSYFHAPFAAICFHVFLSRILSWTLVAALSCQGVTAISDSHASPQRNSLARRQMDAHPMDVDPPRQPDRQAQIAGTHMMSRPLHELPENPRHRIMEKLRLGKLETMVKEDWKLYRTPLSHLRDSQHVGSGRHHDHQRFRAAYVEAFEKHGSPSTMSPERPEWWAVRSEAAHKIKSEDIIRDVWERGRPLLPEMRWPRDRVERGLDFSAFHARCQRQFESIRAKMPEQPRRAPRFGSVAEDRWHRAVKPTDLHKDQGKLSEWATREHMRQLKMEEEHKGQKWTFWDVEAKRPPDALKLQFDHHSTHSWRPETCQCRRCRTERATHEEYARRGMPAQCPCLSCQNRIRSGLGQSPSRQGSDHPLGDPLLQAGPRRSFRHAP